MHRPILWGDRQVSPRGLPILWRDRRLSPRGLQDGAVFTRPCTTPRCTTPGGTPHTPPTRCAGAPWAASETHTPVSSRHHRIPPALDATAHHRLRHLPDRRGEIRRQLPHLRVVAQVRELSAQHPCGAALNRPHHRRRHIARADPHHQGHLIGHHFPDPNCQPCSSAICSSSTLSRRQRARPKSPPVLQAPHHVQPQPRQPSGGTTKPALRHTRTVRNGTDKPPDPTLFARPHSPTAEAAGEVMLNPRDGLRRQAVRVGFEGAAVPAAQLGGGFVGCLQKPRDRMVWIIRGAHRFIGQQEFL